MVKFTSFSRRVRTALQRAVFTLRFKKFMFILATLLLFLPVVTADAQQYLTWGVTRDNTFEQEGYGVWPTAGANYQRVENFTNKPLVEDIDDDGANEIIIIRGTDLQIYNFTSGVGLALEATYNLGTLTYSNSNDFYQTPGLIDYDSDNLVEIVFFNRTRLSVLEWNTTHVTIEQNATAGFGTGVGFDFARWPVIKCAPANQFASDNITCVTPIRHFSAGSPRLCMLAYDLDSNNVSIGGCHTFANGEDVPRNTHLVDGDNDGFLEVYYAPVDSPNDDMRVYEYEIASDDTITDTLLYTHAFVGISQPSFTDIIVNNLDGSRVGGLEITWGFTADNTNWEACTINAITGTVDECSYCTALTCPEGELASNNMVLATDTTYCLFSGDVYYYLRNAANNDPGLNTDTVHCISRFAGSQTQETTITNTENFTFPFYVHQTEMYQGSIGLLTSLFGISGASKQSSPVIGTQQWTVPVDYSQTGTNDVIGVESQTRMVYYDDLHTNALPLIQSQVIGTGNPVCWGVVQRVTPTVSDSEGNTVTCFVEQRWINGTSKINTSNNTFIPTGSPEFLLTQDQIGSFELITRCTDQFNTGFSSRTYLMTVSNNTNVCKGQDENPQSTNFVTDTGASGDNEFLDGVDATLENMGVSSNRAKAIVWLFIMAFVAIGAGIVMAKAGMTATNGFFTVAVVEVITMLIGWYFNFVSTVVLVMVGLVVATILTILLTTRLVSEG